MTLTLTVDAAAWRTRVDEVAAAYRPLVPVVKGNGYGFGRERLATIAAGLLDGRHGELAPTIAVGTAHELVDVADGLRQLVLTPVGPADAPLLRGRDVIATVASTGDVDAVGGAGPRAVLVKAVSSMRRFGAEPGEVGALIAHASAAGFDVIGASIHLPIAGDDTARVAEIEAWLPALEPHLGARHLWVSHLAPDAHRDLAGRHPAWAFPMRVGSRLWHGDKAALHLGAEVLAVRPVAAGTLAGYHATAIAADGWLAIVGAGTAHGVGPLADGRSPFHHRRRRIALLEPPHMHVSMLFVPAGDPVPEPGETVDVQRPLHAVAVDRTVWTEPRGVVHQ